MNMPQCFRDNHVNLGKPMLKGGINQHNSMEDKNNMKKLSSIDYKEETIYKVSLLRLTISLTMEQLATIALHAKPTRSTSCSGSG